MIEFDGSASAASEEVAASQNVENVRSSAAVKSLRGRRRADYRASIRAESTRPEAPRACARSSHELVKAWIARQKEYRKTTGRVTGRFASPLELVVFLAGEISKGERTRNAIAKDAMISRQTLEYLVKMGKVPLAQG